jgi:hypothetical protein
MRRNQDLRKKISGYQKVIAEHEDKIRAELAKEIPNEPRVLGWQREIRIWQEMITRLARRLNRDW